MGGEILEKCLPACVWCLPEPVSILGGARCGVWAAHGDGGWKWKRKMLLRRRNITGRTTAFVAESVLVRAAFLANSPKALWGRKNKQTKNPSKTNIQNNNKQAGFLDLFCSLNGEFEGIN